MSAFLRKYATGTGADLDVPIIKRAVVDFAVSADWTPAAGDVKISIDGGATANIGTLPVAVAMGNTAYWKFVFSNAELTGKRMIVTVADSATKAVEDQAFVIETYGHASAMYPVDYSLANLPANVTQLLGTAWLTPAVAGTPDVNTKLISGSTEAADRLERAALAIATGTVGAASTTTSVVSSACSPSGSVADQFKGRIITFDKDTTTAALRGQATDITASSNAATPTFTVTALTTAPASGDTFTIT